ncbi:peptide MFS transporter [Rubrivirga sp. S365]|uniref:peptide MFS transporter n=1 Tax=Rubrivirga sp. S365 TaxID=3076080 RepID=UPI0028C797A7|nr:peptide MFS transporter [Rubrivirga sp. S365]MDT7858019.1 peptide MFS transporter [Rubrivirga sp. S365]
MSKGPDAEASTDLAAHEIAAAGGAAAAPVAIGANDTRFFGHPLGLSNLFFTELFERFSYYGMRALLVLFMTAQTVDGGLGYDVATSALIYGFYTSLVYLVNLPGGWIADRLLGQRRSVLIGGTVIALGHFTMAVPTTAFFYAGLGLIVLGTGLLKPNISVMVGQLYPAEDARRDAGFTIFYMGINMGAFAAPLVCGALAVNYGWHYGFAAAGVGMAVGMIVYVLFGKQLGNVGALTAEAVAEKSAARGSFLKGLGAVVVLVAVLGGLMAAGVIAQTAEAITTVYTVVLLAIVLGLFGWLFSRDYWTEAERKRLYLIGLLFVGAAIFWAAFEQAGTSLNLFAQESTDRVLPSWLAWIPGLELLPSGLRAVPAAWFQSANAFFIFTIAPVVAAIWVSLGRRGKDPASPTKFGIGLVLLGLGFVVMVGAGIAAGSGAQVSPWWLVLTYLLHTLGELTLSPVGLSAMTKLAPARVSSLMMGVWFLGASVGNFIAGFIASFYETMELPSFMGLVAAIAIAAGVVFFFVAGPFKRMMAKAESASVAA